MTVVTITYPKYYEIHNQIVDPVLGAELMLFHTHFKCHVQISKERLYGQALIDLVFDAEEDAMWFKLKCL